MAILRNPYTGDDEPLDPYDDDPCLCPVHGCECEPDGDCDMCTLEHYENSLTWDEEDEGDDRFERERDRDYEAAA